MSIKPWVDEASNDVGNPVGDPWAAAKEAAADLGLLAATGAMDTSEVDRFRQGISTRGPSDFVVSMLPWISDRGLPTKASERFDPSIEKNTYGQPKLYEDLGNAGPFNDKFLPFDDIAGIHDPVGFVQDPGTQRYPVVLLSPNWLDPASMDGIIEPLAIRESLTNASIGGPWVAHDVRATLQPTRGPEILGDNIEISTFIQFEPRPSIRPFFDAQDIAMSSGSYAAVADGGAFTVSTAISMEGYAFPEPGRISPFADVDTDVFNTTDINFNEFELSGSFMSTGKFIDDPRFGTLGKCATVGFVFRGGNYVVNDDISGNRRVNGFDSIAFGGFLK
tara:strand:+ start:1341 stop:2342 length:1002 start_codon:yes stop_codon:yes gene_type:complete